MDIRIQCLCIDTTDPARLAKFWQEALGWRLERGPDGNEVVLEPPEGSPEDG
jgi:predicted enzyme related to lactoylglutathione lyase